MSGFGLGLLVSRGFLGAKAGFGGFGLGLLVSRGFFDAKAFFAVVREGVADKPGKILCSVFLFFPGFLGLLGSQGEPGFYFFTGTLWKGSFFGGRLCFFSAFPVAPPNVYTNSLLKAGLGL